MDSNLTEINGINAMFLKKQSDYVYNACKNNINQDIILFTKEGVGIRSTGRIFTDRLKNYRYLLNAKLHSVKRFGTNNIERKNLSLRTHLKRLNRKTICS